MFQEDTIIHNFETLKKKLFMEATIGKEAWGEKKGSDSIIM